MCVYALHLPLVCEMGSLPHACELTGMPTHGHTQTQDSMTCHLHVHRSALLSLTCAPHTHTHRHASLLQQPLSPASLLFRPSAGPHPCPLIHLACQPVLGAPISFLHLLILLLNSRRQARAAMAAGRWMGWVAGCRGPREGELGRTELWAPQARGAGEAWTGCEAVPRFIPLPASVALRWTLQRVPG